MRYLLSVMTLLVAACTGAAADAPEPTTPAATLELEVAPPPPATTPPTTVAVTTTSTTTTTSSTTTSTTTTTTLPDSAAATLTLSDTIYGDISPKSVVSSGTGLFFAQNMMYRHTITVYDDSGELVATIPDEVVLSDYGFTLYEGSYRGAPVEVAFTADGAFAYVSNYQMYGPGFSQPGHDSCARADWDESFLYRIDTTTLEIDDVIAVGAVPKYLVVTPDDSRVLVANWCSYDLSVVAVDFGVEVARVPIGRFPRGIAITADSTVAYVAVMGSAHVAVVDLGDYSVDYIEDVGPSPRHLVLDPGGAFLYVTLNGSGEVVKIDVATQEVVGRVSTGSTPRSMDISADGRSLYVVNYNADTVSKVSTTDMVEVAELPTDHHPIGITYDAATASVWVSNYSGSIQIFADS